ncbi:hypothetical protein [Dawidia soli]|uniref:Uncharacterized protein n=1 Tax=Dawidia soli TaxID=2782352 RepID=A0AAP2D9C7_9BACT|nr:hypothetical protein [Dawidia soli]MBT1686725.1 hypothetical protein [Dawidia soli]
MIKVGFCVSYDWEFLKRSLPPIYDHADKICFSLDKNRRSWSQQPYAFDEAAFAAWLQQADPQKKIDLYEDDFSLPELTALQNDSRQRMLMAQRLGEGGWHVQVDSDEYFLDFEAFVRFLLKINPAPTGKEKPLNVCPCLVPLIKRVPGGYLYVDFQGYPEVAPMATTRPHYKAARRSGHFNKVAPSYVIHETWARSDDALWYKISNWGHSDDELNDQRVRQSYYNLWKAMDAFNYQYIKDFHPGKATDWPALGFCAAESVEEFMRNYTPPPFPLSSGALWIKNNRTVARIKALYHKLFR